LLNLSKLCRVLLCLDGRRTRILSAVRRRADALDRWQPADLNQLAALLDRMLDDFIAHSGQEGPRRPPETGRSETAEQESR
jgi:hypothetical protein